MRRKPKLHFWKDIKRKKFSIMYKIKLNWLGVITSRVILLQTLNAYSDNVPDLFLFFFYKSYMVLKLI